MSSFVSHCLRLAKSYRLSPADEDGVHGGHEHEGRYAGNKRKSHVMFIPSTTYQAPSTSNNSIEHRLSWHLRTTLIHFQDIPIVPSSSSTASVPKSSSAKRYLPLTYRPCIRIYIYKCTVRACAPSSLNGRCHVRYPRAI